jgi:CheY-like chemotaxis protein
MSARIGVIEDNAANLDLMVYLLRAFGHTALVAHNGREGSRMIRSHQPDLVVCDIAIPEIDGYEIARRVKLDPALRRIPLVAVTAFAMAAERRHLLEAGFDAYISKPINPETFVAELEAFLPERAQPHAAAHAFACEGGW